MEQVSRRRNLLGQRLHLHVATRIFLGHNLIDEPLGRVQYLGGGVISDKLVDTFEILLARRLTLGIPVTVREEDKHPLIPRLHHSHDAQPAELRMLEIRLHDPVKVTPARVNQVGEICLDQHIDGKALAGLPGQREFELLDDLALGSVCSKQVAGSDPVDQLGDLVTDYSSYQASRRILGKGQENCVEGDSEAVVRGMADQNRLKEGLRNIDGIAGASCLIVALYKNVRDAQ